MRDKIIEQLRDEIIGPCRVSTDEKKNEVLNESPLIRYISGILEPQSSSIDLSNDVIVDDNSTIEISSDVLNESSIDEGLSASNTSQSSFGISFMIPKDNATDYNIELHYGTYERFNTDEGRIRYKRTNNHFISAFNTRDILNAKSDKLEIDVIASNGEPNELGLFITNRTRDSGYIDLNEKLLLTLSVYNKNVWQDIKRPPFDLCFFQVELGIQIKQGTGGFLPYPEPLIFESWDNKLNALLYRDVHTYGVGHSCSIEWPEQKEVKSLFSTFLPQYEINLLKHAVSDNIE